MTKTEELLEKARVDGAQQLLHEVAVSMASFIAEIDPSSSAVADYIEQRLAPLKGMVLTDARVRDAVERVAKDGRKLPANHGAEPAFFPKECIHGVPIAATSRACQQCDLADLGNFAAPKKDR